MTDDPARGTRGAPPASNVRAGEPATTFALVDDPIFLEHRSRGYHPERPERLLAARDAVEALTERGVTFDTLAPRDATREELERVHTPAYLDALAKADGLYAALDDDTYLSPKSVEAAKRAAGGAIAMVDTLLSPQGPKRALALVRPPGHHARPDGGMGFCLLNNVAIAARAAIARGIERVAIVDWDVHHGNGTQDAFYEDPRVLFTSMHQYPFYPGTGAAKETGAGEGTGFTVNVPLSQNAGDATYAHVLDAIVLPVLDAYQPELVLISAGFDAHVRDPLASMLVTPRGYRQMAEGVARIADRWSGGRVGVVFEGGYDLGGITESFIATLEALAGLEASLRPPKPPADARPVPEEDGPVSERHDVEIERARRTAQKAWKI